MVQRSRKLALCLVVATVVSPSTSFSLPPTRGLPPTPSLTRIQPALHRSSPNLLLNMKEPTEVDSLIPPSLDEKQPKPTTGQAILELAVPAAAALLVDPLMTLMDTIFVGRFSDSPEPLAGMGSAAALLTFSFYLFNFLCTATTPLVGAQRAAGREAAALAVGGQALSLALLLGSVLTAVLWTFQQPLLRLMGTSITGEAANEYALAFLSVRALAAPAVLCLEASTGILRGYLDTKTPIVILLASNLVNLLLDVVLIAFLGMGPMGAAIATTTAEWISAGLFLAVLGGVLPSAAGQLGKGSVARDGTSLVVTPTLAIPSWKEVQPLLVASSSVFFRALVLQLSLSGAAAMAARSGEGLEAASAVAAHQIGIQLWIICSFFCDSLAAASQGLVADALGREDSEGVREIARTIFVYSAILGFGLAALLQTGESTDVLFHLFTSDPLTQDALGRILPLIVIAQPLNSLVFAADGVLQGASEFPFQAKSMLLSGATAVTTFVLFETLGLNPDTLVDVWMALLTLQLMRGVTSLYKLLDSNGPVNLLNRHSPTK